MRVYRFRLLSRERAGEYRLTTKIVKTLFDDFHRGHRRGLTVEQIRVALMSPSYFSPRNPHCLILGASFVTCEYHLPLMALFLLYWKNPTAAAGRRLVLVNNKKNLFISFHRHISWHLVLYYVTFLYISINQKSVRDTRPIR